MSGSQSTTTPRTQRFGSARDTASSPTSSHANSQSRERMRPLAATRAIEAAAKAAAPTAVRRRARLRWMSLEVAADLDCIALSGLRVAGIAMTPVGEDVARDRD